MDGLAHTGLHPGVMAETADRFPGDRRGRIGARAEPGAGCIPLPRLPQEGEEPRGEPAIPVLLAFPLLEAEDQAGTIDIGDVEVTEFGDPQACGVAGGKHGPAFETARGAEQRRDCGLTQDRREGGRPLGVGKGGEHVGLAKRDGGEKAQGTDGLHDARPGDARLLDEREWILADLLGAEAVRWRPEVLGELGHTAERAIDGLGGIVP